MCACLHLKVFSLPHEQNWLSSPDSFPQFVPIHPLLNDEKKIEKDLKKKKLIVKVIM